MAEFVNVYATKKENIDKTFIRGDIVIVNREKLYIVDKYGRKNYMCKLCNKCSKFHICDQELEDMLGKFWYKYKKKYINIGLIYN